MFSIWYHSLLTSNLDNNGFVFSFYYYFIHNFYIYSSHNNFTVIDDTLSKNDQIEKVLFNTCCYNLFAGQFICLMFLLYEGFC